MVNGIDGLTPATAAVLVAAGSYHSCALMQNGSVTCWGYNFSGQIGDGSTTTRNAPVAVTTLSGSSDIARARHIAVGSEHTCVVMHNGSVRCWGRGSNGQLGNGSVTNSLLPAEVMGIDGASESRSARSLDAGGFHSCALMQDGRARCWGYGIDGQLGDGRGSQSSIPVSVSGI